MQASEALNSKKTNSKFQKRGNVMQVSRNYNLRLKICTFWVSYKTIHQLI